MLSSRYLLSYLFIARCLAFHAPALLSKSSLSSSCPRSRNLQHRLARQHQLVQQRLFMMSEDDTTSNNNLVEETTTETTAASSIPTSISASSSSLQPPPASSATEQKPYPIDIPSPILLASSIFLSIASIGTSNKHSQVGANNWFSIRKYQTH